MSDVQSEIKQAEDLMRKAIDHLEQELTKVRAGRANPNMLEGIRVDYYGSEVPLTQVSNVNTPDARTITIQPWEKKMIEPIEKAIIASNLGFNPSNNGEQVIINVPMLTEERRKDLVKISHQYAEQARIAVRHVRRDGMDAAKKAEKDGSVSEDEARKLSDRIQKMTDDTIGRIDKLGQEKEAEIMHV